MSDSDTSSSGRPRRRRSQDAAPRSGMPRWLKVIVLIVLIAVAVIVLFTTVFPWVEERMQDPTMGTMTLRLATALR